MSARRAFDLMFAPAILLATGPVILLAMLLVWLQDGGSPLYRAPRVGRSGRPFLMLKIRTMRMDADRMGGASTARSDRRVTPLGKGLRRLKLDELPQFWNVIRGEMSVVGPRPNLLAGGVDGYTPAEMALLDVRPGITDLASIVFADEADILDGWPDPHEAYDLLIRPWKSRLGLLYVTNHSLGLDLHLVWLTVMALFARSRALRGIDALLARMGADAELREACRRNGLLPMAAPPGLAA